MHEKNAQLFEEFQEVHQAYLKNPEQAKAEFDRVGMKVLDVMRDWERKLCSAMGRTMYGKYAQLVSEKFWDLARQDYEQIDMVGVKVEKA